MCLVVIFGDDDDDADIDVGGGGGGGGGGGLFEGIDDGCAGGAGNRCAGITTGVMALTMLASWQMRFSVGMDEVLILVVVLMR
jgi:hypothetical protein